MVNKNEIVNLFKNFNKLNVLIVGDVMIDSYFYAVEEFNDGVVDRCSKYYDM